jgi:hypothetical protein
MAGIVNDVLYALNADFTGGNSLLASESNGLVTNGKMWIGSTAVNAGGTHINVGSITSPLGTLLIGYSSPNITLDLVGGGAAVEHLTGDSGGLLNPTANNFNILGLSGSKTSGSGSTITVKSPPFSQIGSSATSSLNTGEFVTAAVTRTLPASVGLADGDLFIYVCTTAGVLVIQSVTAQKIRLGNVITSAAGSATSTAIGDSISLRFNATDGFFYAVSSIGNWTLSP